MEAGDMPLGREDGAGATKLLELRAELEPPGASPRVEAVRKMDCNTRVFTWSTSAMATAGLTAGAVAAETSDVVGRLELATDSAGELDVGVELVQVATVGPKTSRNNRA